MYNNLVFLIYFVHVIIIIIIITIIIIVLSSLQCHLRGARVFESHLPVVLKKKNRRIVSDFHN